MRVGVLTFHRCINYGSYWQARCLVEAISARGHKAVLLDHQSRDVTSREWRYAFQPLTPDRSSRADVAQYGRKLRTVTRGNRSLGEMLVEEGLARRWNEPRPDWCVRG